MESNSGIVYILTNKGMPGLVKIGECKKQDLEDRMKQLYTTGVPFPFQCIFATEVNDADNIEGILHNAFADYRINPKREFFTVSPDRIIPLLSAFSNSNVTNEVKDAIMADVPSDEIEAERKYQRRPNLNFEEMKIPIGGELIYKKDPTKIAHVISEHKVEYNNNEYTLSELTRKLLGIAYPIAPKDYWMYNGVSLLKIYNDTYPQEDDMSSEDLFLPE